MKNSRASQLAVWRKKNPKKVRISAQKNNFSYYQKTKEKRSVDFKIQYYRYAIRTKILYQYYEDVDDKLQLITVDHDFFDNKFPKPHIIWIGIKKEIPTLEQIKDNINCVLRLQQKKRMPIFLVKPPESYDLQNQIESFGVDFVWSLQCVEKQDYDNKIKIFEKEKDELFTKILHENYEKHILKNKKLKYIL